VRRNSHSNDRPIWCDHPGRGRVDFPTGLPALQHGIVLIETFTKVDLAEEAADLPLAYGSNKGQVSVNRVYLSVVERCHLRRKVVKRALTAQTINRKT
jgi:hypothetical protein